jgi:hypothetical protein
MSTSTATRENQTGQHQTGQHQTGQHQTGEHQTGENQSWGGLVDRIGDYIRHEELVSRSTVTVGELIFVFDLDRLDVYRILQVLETRGDVVKQGDEIVLSKRNRPCWIGAR